MKPSTPEECLAAQAWASAGLDDALKKILAGEDPASPLYKMLQYFLGFLNERFEEEKPGAGGKRFRSALALFIAEQYGARDAAFDAALSIELFHNFTLIHDDIADRDEERRKRPTLWKQWGINHALNGGDMLGVIAAEVCARTPPEQNKILFSAFKEVIEGQYLDFELAERPVSDPLVSKETASLVNKKKTAALIAAACEVAGSAAKRSKEECMHLRSFGLSLGMLFQLADDHRSIWATLEETGKDAQSDIREHKRTLPFFFAYEALSDKKARLQELYELKRQMGAEEVQEAIGLIDSTEAREKTFVMIQKYADEARTSVHKLAISDEGKSILLGIVEMLAKVTK